MVSDFCIAELVASISRHVRVGRYRPEQGIEIIDAFDGWVRRQTCGMTTESGDVARATTLIKRFDLGLRGPDALHIALCERVGAALLTFAGNQAEAAAIFGITLAA